jgi:hypothetical protein
MMYRAVAIASLLASAALAGCVTSSGSRPRADFVRGPSPEVMIDAEASVVRDVITDRARAAGSTLAAVGGNQLALERPSQSQTPEVIAACGPARSGGQRLIRVVLTTTAQGKKTALREDRFIVDTNAGARSLCPMPLTAADREQAITALGRVKVQAEAVQNRIRGYAGT